ncbi:hypothetical protein VTN77DRAFT_2194 [Rasamsonia byssochlamydoides]|uniref:uncharacterized protein n=1 Tax=Rasamsonia byssochlamydoides TaxID=89139 RepID=UPI00374353D4
MASTPGRSPPPEALPAVPEKENGNGVHLHVDSKRSSLGFLRRSKSTEPLGERKVSGGKFSKKMSKEQAREEELRRQREAIPQHAPRLPDLVPTPQLKTFGGEDRPDSETTSRPSVPPVPPVPMIDPYARTESMTHRGRYSYASSAVSSVNGPRRLRRRKDPTPYNLLVVGTRNCGKTSFLEFLRKSLALPPHKHPIRSPDEFDEQAKSSANYNFTSHYLETEIEGERVGVTLWDSEGLEKNLVDLQLREITAFLESKFEETFTEEMKVVRSPGVRDTHIHCVFLILDPVRLDSNIAAAKRAAEKANGSIPSSPRIVGILDEDLDLQVLRIMQGKTTVVPVISKADTITTAHMAYLKKAVWDSLKQANIDPLEILTLEEQEDSSPSENGDRSDENEEEESEGKSAVEKEDADDQTGEADAQPASDERPAPGSPSSKSQTTRKSSVSAPSSDVPLIPLSILSPDPHSLESTDGPVGRQFPWGFADPYNPEHCDFVKLKDAVFREWRSELREASREIWYERWRTSRLNRRAGSSAPKQFVQGRYGPPPFKGGRMTR